MIFVTLQTLPGPAVKYLSSSFFSSSISSYKEKQYSSPQGDNIIYGLVTIVLDKTKSSLIYNSDDLFVLLVASNNRDVFQKNTMAMTEIE